MNTFFTILLIVVAIGGGLSILIFFGEYGKWTNVAFLSLFMFIGILILIWGLYNHLTGTVVYPWKGGGAPATGVQLALVGAGMLVWFGFLLYREWQRIQKE